MRKSNSEVYLIETLLVVGWLWWCCWWDLSVKESLVMSAVVLKLFENG
jgi:hypothetical protein